MFRLRQCTPESSDCTCGYSVELDKEYTVREFVDTVLRERSNEWGNFYIGDKSPIFNNPEYRYRYGKLLKEIPVDILDMRIASVDASGGWTRMDYQMSLDCGKEYILSKGCLQEFPKEHVLDRKDADRLYESESRNEVGAMIKPEGAVKEMLDNFAKEYGGADAAENKTNRNSIEIGVKVQPENEATAQLLAGVGVLNADGYLHMQKGDVLVLRTDKMLIPSHREEFEKSMSENLGIKVVLIDRVTEVVGVVEHGT